MKREVREPIQVYLTSDERSELDSLAGKMELSRSEVLRRGIAMLAQSGGAMAPEIEHPLIRPPTMTSGPVPAGPPVARLDELLDELRRDRDSH